MSTRPVDQHLDELQGFRRGSVPVNVMLAAAGRPITFAVVDLDLDVAAVLVWRGGAAPDARVGGGDRDAVPVEPGRPGRSRRSSSRTRKSRIEE